MHNQRKEVKSKVKDNWIRWLFPITGLLATIWFLVRVIPKPSRATYPCQCVAFPFASSFIAYILGLFGTGVALRKAQRRLSQSRYVLAGICIFVGLACIWLTISINSERADAAYAPPDLPNTPVGLAKGIFPGRVVWAHDPDATYWDPAWNDSNDIFYWDRQHTNEAVVEKMVSACLRQLPGEKTDKAAWEALFRYFNKTHKKGDVGYKAGEKITIKPNFVEGRRHKDEDNYADLSPQVLLALLKQLVQKAGVPQNCITICDSSRYLTDKFFYKCHNLFPDIVYTETNYYIFRGVNDINTDPNRPAVKPTKEDMIFYSGINTKDGNVPIPNDKLPIPYVEADYLINLAILKTHGSAGVTLCAKNWYGCFCRKPGRAHHRLSPWKVSEYGKYRLLADLMGHKHLGQKAMLFIVDGLWGFPSAHSSGSEPKKWKLPPFNGDYPSSIFMSQDHVAIDSVGLDFLRAEFAENMGGRRIQSGIDDYLHEAALADNPPSGTLYDPHHPIGDANAVRLRSLGVHEHWNNQMDKQYSRNIGTGDGIELVKCAQSVQQHTSNKKVTSK